MKRAKEETHLIFKRAVLSGYSCMFPKGVLVFIQKAVISEDGTGQYYGLVFRGNQAVEVQFDLQTLKLKGFDARSDSITLDQLFINWIQV